jgi:hypothetical protein
VGDVYRSTSTQPPPVCSFVSYTLMCVWHCDLYILGVYLPYGTSIYPNTTGASWRGLWGTGPTHVCIHRDHHCRDYLYNIEIWVVLKVQHGSEHNLNSMGRGDCSSQPTPKKKPCFLSESRHFRPPRPQTTPEQTWEKTPIIRADPCECTVEYDHKPLLPVTTRRSEATTYVRTHPAPPSIDLRWLTYLCRGPSASSSPSDGRICFPSPDLSMSWPPPLQIPPISIDYRVFSLTTCDESRGRHGLVPTYTLGGFFFGIFFLRLEENTPNVNFRSVLGDFSRCFNCSIPRARFASYHHTRETQIPEEDTFGEICCKENTYEWGSVRWVFVIYYNRWNESYRKYIQMGVGVMRD